MVLKKAKVNKAKPKKAILKAKTKHIRVKRPELLPPQPILPTWEEPAPMVITDSVEPAIGGVFPEARQVEMIERAVPAPDLSAVLNHYEVAELLDQSMAKHQQAKLSKPKNWELYRDAYTLRIQAHALDPNHINPAWQAEQRHTPPHNDTHAELMVFYERLAAYGRF